MTLNELFNATLRKVGVLGSGQTALSADTTLVQEAFDALANEIDITTESVTPGTGMYLANILAGDIADDFQMEETKLQRLLATRKNNIREVKIIINGEYDTDQVTEAPII